MSKAKGFGAEFKKFIMRGNVIDLAVGVIVGGAFQAIVKSLVDDVVMPVISLATKGLDFTNWFIALDGSEYATLEAAQEAGAATLNYGNFISAVINFPGGGRTGTYDHDSLRSFRRAVGKFGGHLYPKSIRHAHGRRTAKAQQKAHAVIRAGHVYREHQHQTQTESHQDHVSQNQP